MPGSDFNNPFGQQRFNGGGYPYQQSYGPPMGVLQVNGRQSAERLDIPPNRTAIAFDINRDVFYYIQTDSACSKIIDEYDFVKHVEEKPPEPEYITRKEFYQEIESLKGVLINGKQSVRAAKRTAQNELDAGDSDG